MADGKTRKTRTVKRRKTTAPTKDLPSVAAAPKKRGKVGRPTKMTEAVEKEIEAVCRLACRPSYNFIAEYIGVNTATFQNWLKAYKGLRENIDHWRTAGMASLRLKAQSIAATGDGAMLRYILDRTEPDFKPKHEVDGEIKANWSTEFPPPDFL